MSRQSFLADDPWTAVHGREHLRTRVFDRPKDALLGATLHELLPGSSGYELHMHYGCEEMFFVVEGTPTLRNGTTEEELSPGDVVYCAQGREGLHTFTNPTSAPARILAVSAGRFPDVVAYPELGHAWVATRDPDRMPEGADPGLIARFDLPEED